MAARALPGFRGIVLALVIALAAVIAVAGPLASRASAVSVEVTTAQEFRDAIDAINLTTGESHTIQIEADLVFDGSGGGTITTDAELAILGWDHTVSCINSCGTFLYAYDGATEVEISDLTITGFTDSALRIDYGDLIVNDSTFEDNVKSPAGSNAEGAAIRNVGGGSLTLDGVTFDGNQAIATGIYYAGGGAVYHSGSAEVMDSVFTNNSASVDDATAQGGALFVDGDGSGTVTINDSVFADNAANAGTGGSSNSHGGAVYVNALAAGSEITGTHFEENFSSYYAGAVDVGSSPNFLIDESSFVANSAPGGGGALTDSGSATVVSNSTFEDNSTSYYGGAMWAIGGGTFVVASSLFKGNEAWWGGAVAANSFALYLTVASSTFTENESVTGSAISTYGADLNLQHATVTNNAAYPAPAGGQLYIWDADATVSASVIVDPAGGGTNCVFYGTGTAASGGYNYLDDTSCTLMGTGDTADTGNDPLLGDLEFYGGPTWVMVPGADSPLIDAIPNASCIPGARDQRDVIRPQDGGCDIGAVEQLEPLIDTFSTPGGEVWVRILNAVDAEGGPVSISSLTPAPPAGVAFPYGAMELGIEVWDDGWPADIQFFSPAPTTQLWKLFDGAWVEPPGATHENGEGGTLWTFRVTDGGFGDNDGDEDGFIVDPSALGVAASFTG